MNLFLDDNLTQVFIIYLSISPDIASHSLVPARLPVSARALRLDRELPRGKLGASLELNRRQLVEVEFWRDFADVVLVAQPACCTRV